MRESLERRKQEADWASGLAAGRGCERREVASAQALTPFQTDRRPCSCYRVSTVGRAPGLVLRGWSGDQQIEDTPLTSEYFQSNGASGYFWQVF